MSCNMAMFAVSEPSCLQRSSFSFSSIDRPIGYFQVLIRVGIRLDKYKVGCFDDDCEILLHGFQDNRRGTRSVDERVISDISLQALEDDKRPKAISTYVRSSEQGIAYLKGLKSTF